MLLRGLAERCVPHHSRENRFVPLHAVDEQVFQDAVEIGGEVREIIGPAPPRQFSRPLSALART